jgi:DNA helicase-2/ATP-dependent DNA helicase PcrA
MMPALVPLDNGGAQASFVAQRILELRDEGVELNEIAVIYRAHFHSLEIQLELTNRGIPFTITSGLRFFEQAHVKDVAAFMKFAVNRQDEVSSCVSRDSCPALEAPARARCGRHGCREKPSWDP